MTHGLKFLPLRTLSTLRLILGQFDTQLREEMCYFLSILNYALSEYKMLVTTNPNTHTTSPG